MRTRQDFVQIDFDEASAAWRANKISLGNGMYSYKPERNIEETNNRERPQVVSGPRRSERLAKKQL